MNTEPVFALVQFRQEQLMLAISLFYSQKWQSIQENSLYF